jgi:serine/threonine-protein kinase SRPK3
MSEYSYNPFRCLENPAMYKPGGYHPLEIGDQLHNGRYEIIHRLGHGAYSTVWLALDRFRESTAPRYVAVKIGTANNQKDEVAILSQLRPQLQSRGWLYGLWSLIPFVSNTERDEFPFVVKMLDEFEIHGPNGLHRCLVTELLGPSVAAVKQCPAIEGYHLLPVTVARQAAVQCAKALASLHSHGIVHGGMFRTEYLLGERLTGGSTTDVHTGNVAFALSVDIHSWTVEEVYAALGGEPSKVPFHEALRMSTSKLPPTDSPHQPKYLVGTPHVPRLWELCSSSSQPPSIRIIDFTESFRIPFTPELQRLPGTPRDFAAPELLLNLLCAHMHEPHKG